MYRLQSCLSSWACILLSVGTGFSADLTKNIDPRVSFESSPLTFEANAGQNKSDAQFIGQGRGYTAQISPAKITLDFGVNERAVTVDFLGANRASKIEGHSLLPGKLNYFPDPDQRNWRTDVATYSEVQAKAVYSGVDLSFYGNQKRLEFDFIVQPHVDPSVIRFRLSGSDRVKVSPEGDLALSVGDEQFRFLKPVVYQIANDGKRRLIEAGYRLTETAAANSPLISFSIGKYDPNRDLIIDPVASGEALSFSEYTLGYAQSVAVDSSGNSYVAGLGNDNNGLYVTKYNSAGVQQFTTRIGSQNKISAYGLAVDNKGNIDLAGGIAGGSSTIPVTSGAFQNTTTATASAFFVQVSASGSSINYATYLDGGSDTTAYSIAVDSSNMAYLTGVTSSTAFPTTTGAYQTNFAGNTAGFVAKIDPTKTGSASLVYSTLLGNSQTTLYGIAVDSSGNAYVTGNAPSGFPVTTAAFQYKGYDSSSGGVYVTKLNPTGTGLVYSAYLGYGTGYGIAVEGQSSPSVYVTGQVSYGDFPTTPGAYQTAYPGGFVAKLSADGSTELYSTLLGGPSSYAEGTNNFVPVSLALPAGCSSSCNAYVSGYTSTADMPLQNAMQSQANQGAGYSAFVTELNSAGTAAIMSSYLSGFMNGVNEPANLVGSTPALAVYPSGNFILVGNAEATLDFPATIPTPNRSYGFLAKISSSSSGLLEASQASVNFGSEPANVSTSSYGGTATFRIANYSSTAATLAQPIQVSPGSIFSESDNCGTSIPAGGFCSVNVDFTPTASGVRSGAITVTSNATNSPLTVALTGTGVDEGLLQVSQSSLTFSAQNIETSSNSQTFTLTNTSDETVMPTFAFSSGVNFSQLNNCPSPIAPGVSCTINVTFKPNSAGLLTDSLTIGGGYQSEVVSISGTGTVAGAIVNLTFNVSVLNFNPQIVGTTSSESDIYVTNNSSEPVTIQGVTASPSDFAVDYSNCGAPPYQLNPQASCYIGVEFSPTLSGTRSGNLTLADATTGSSQNIPLNGTGLASATGLEIYPSASVSFPDQPMSVQSGSQAIYLENTGSAPISVYRVVVSGDFSVLSENCSANAVPGTASDGSGAYSYCDVNVVFTPAAVGARSGTLTIYDSAPGSPHTVSLMGNGLPVTGAGVASPSATNFPATAIQSVSAGQTIYINNPGDMPITVTGITFPADFSNAGGGYTTPFVVPAGSVNEYYVQVQFSPLTAGSKSETLTFVTSAGNANAALAGTGVASTSIEVLPPSLSFGSLVTGSKGATNYIYVRNQSTASVTFTSMVLGGTNPGDFNFNAYTCPSSGGQLAANTSCELSVSFQPTGAGSRSATITLTDNASGGPQIIKLTGTGVSVLPSYTTNLYGAGFDAQVIGTVGTIQQYIIFSNNTGSPVVMGTTAASGAFLVPPAQDGCSGTSVAAGSSCGVFVQFAPTSAAFLAGTLTFKNSANTSLAVVALAGLGLTPSYGASVNPTGLNFPAQQVVKTISVAQSVTFTNTGNTSLTLGNLTGTDSGAGATAEFSTGSVNGGADSCSGQIIAASATCNVTLAFVPLYAGARTGTLAFPITYANATTTSVTVNLSGTGVNEKNTAVLNPVTSAYLDQAVGVSTSYSTAVTLTNTGNQPLYVGMLTGTNAVVGASATGEFSTAFSAGGGDQCSGAAVAVGSGCSIYVVFTPSAAGTRAGTIWFPVTYADQTAATFKLSLSGNGVASVKKITINPPSIQFAGQIQGTTSLPQLITVTNNGNVPVNIGVDSITSNPAEFQILYDFCPGTLNPNQSCAASIMFTPSATSSGTRTGTLQLGDDATGGPHSISLSGVAVAAGAQVVLSQTALSFGNEPLGSASTTQSVYLTNRGDVSVALNSLTLGGTNAGDFAISAASCPVGSSLGARTNCTFSVTFIPTATGLRTATITEADGNPGSPRTITLNGFGVIAVPAVSLTPSAITFATQNVGVSSSGQTFSVTNTGSANLVISLISSTNSAEFPLLADGCSGSALTPSQHCTVSVKFSPALGGTRSTTIKIADNVSGSPQALAATGMGIGIPQATPNLPSLSYTNQNIGATSAAQSVTLRNGGTDKLNIASVSVTGVHAGDYAISANSCGTSLAASSQCSVSVTFTPTAAGTRGAYLMFTDNANNVSGETQQVVLTGTGVATPSVAVTPTALTFPATNTGTAAPGQTVTVTNSGSGPLTIASITIGGSVSSGDFSQVNGCGATLVAGSMCTISVGFTPTALGIRSGTLTITDNAGNIAGATQTVALTGTGKGLALAALTPASLTFTDQNVGTTSGAQTFTLTNPGSGALTIAGVAIAGANGGDFATTNNCLGSVGVGGSCLISVTFKPAASGSRTASLVVTDNAGNVAGSVQSGALSGSGTGVPAATPSPASLTFSGQNVGSTSAAQNITLTNGGTGVLTVSSIAITGPNAVDFTATNTCAGSIAIGGNCSIAVTFSPTAAGSRTAAIVISDNAGNTASNQTVALTGAATGIPRAALSSATAAFGNQNVSSTSSSQTITLSNSGSAALSITSIGITGTNATDFQTTNNCGTSLGAGASCSMAITFDPAAVGTRTATLTLTDNASGTAGATQTVVLTGTGVGVAAASASPTTVVFGDQNVNTRSAPATVTLSNTGTAALMVTGIAVGGANAADFGQTNTCSSVAPGSSCAISVTFDPAGTSARLGSLTITDNANNVAGSTQVVVLTGTGMGVPLAGLSPSSLTFSSTIVGSPATVQNVTLSNTGTGSLSISQIVTGGANPGDFSETTSCGSILAAGASCNISVTFIPTTTGARTANLHVVDNSGNTGSTQTATLAGTGVTTMAGTPKAALSHTALTFQTQTDGVVSLAQTLTLSNVGTVALSVSGISIGGADRADFTETNNCGASVLAGASCTISATFHPTAAGTRTAFITVTDNTAGVSGSTQSATLTGTGSTSKMPTVVSLSPNSGTGPSKIFTMSFSDPLGTADLTSLDFVFNTSASSSSACSVIYTASSNHLFLYNDAGSALLSTAITPGVSGSVSNSRCTINGAGSTLSKSGNSFALSPSITFSAQFTGQQNVYLSAAGSAGNTGFVKEGTWTP